MPRSKLANWPARPLRPAAKTTTTRLTIRSNCSGPNALRIAVNVRSSQKPPDLLYLIKEDFEHPILARLSSLTEGFTLLPPQPAGMALDFIRGNLFDHSDMRLLPSNLPGPDNDLSDRIEHYVKRAIDESAAVVYAFGQRWGPEPGVADKVFDFEPGNGIHDIHMNQGNNAAYRQDDGVWQDGGLCCTFPRATNGSPYSWHSNLRPGIPTTPLAMLLRLGWSRRRPVPSSQRWSILLEATRK